MTEKMLAEVTLEEFLTLAKEEGVKNDEVVKGIWEQRPLFLEYHELAIRLTFREFKEEINARRKEKDGTKDSVAT